MLSCFAFHKEYVSQLLTDEPYIENQKRFQQIPKSDDGMVVLVRASLLVITL